MDLSPAGLAALMRSDTPHAVLDLRERGAYERAHIFRSTSLPRRLIELRVPTLVTARATPLVLVDDDGRLAALAAPTLAAMGYTDVRMLGGGLAAWRAASHRTVMGINVPSKVFGERALHECKTPQITARDLAARIAKREEMVIVDSRTFEEYARGCVPGAISVPGGELVLRIGDLVPRPDTPIVVHCGGRTRSYIGAESLRRMRLPNPIVALENGTMGWELAGLTLERGAGRRAPAPSPGSRAAASVVAKRVAVEDGIAFVTAAELQSVLDRSDRENVVVLDVRTSEEYAEGHVVGALWAPGGQAVQATDEYVAVRAATVVLVCDGFVRSVMTASWLKRMGLGNVSVLAGGLSAWKDAAGSVASGHATPEPFGWSAARAAVAVVEPGRLDGPTIVSVDTSDVYTRGHVPGAVWACRSRLESRIPEIAAGRAASIVVTCVDGVQSTLAGATLLGLGYTGVRVLDGGTRAWQGAGLPVETGATKLLDEPDDVVLKPYEKGREAMEAYLRWEEQLDDDGQSPHALR
ncbi:MAG: sulfurtransferase [Candidatus Rokuibacteriota bacterium]|nr:MAG: sulfurtransferase [Candidatus Rokubacteria bacterium]